MEPDPISSSTRTGSSLSCPCPCTMVFVKSSSTSRVSFWHEAGGTPARAPVSATNAATAGSALARAGNTLASLISTVDQGLAERVPAFTRGLMSHGLGYYRRLRDPRGATDTSREATMAGRFDRVPFLLLLTVGLFLLSQGPTPARAEDAGLIKVSKGAVHIERGGQRLPGQVGA